MPYALLQNKQGKYVYPSVETVAAAAATKPHVSATDFSIVDTDCPQCYPVSGYSWVILYQKPADPQRAKVLKQIMDWLVTEAQPIAKTVQYVPLPENVQKQAQEVLSQMQSQ
jgi:phosphate transport system substrate-binding protein